MKLRVGYNSYSTQMLLMKMHTKNIETSVVELEECWLQVAKRWKKNHSTVLSEELVDNLHKAYKAHLVLEEKGDDEKAEEIIKQCDDMFFENEEEINCKLETYASTIQL